MEIVDTRLGFPEFIDLFLRADAFLIPSCGLHTVSLLQAMACGAATIASDAPAVDEFLTDGETGIAVKGRLGRTAWYDAFGFLNQTFEPMMKSYDAAFASGLVSAMEAMAGDRAMRLRISRAGRDHVARHHAIGPWVDGVGRIFDSVREEL